MAARPASASTARPARAGHDRRRSRGGTLVGIFVGLVIGLLVAFGVAWYLQKTPLPFLDRTGRADQDGATTGNIPAVPPATPLALPGKPGDKPPAQGDKQRFEFYKILPSGQTTVPQVAAAPPADGDGAPTEAQPPAPVEHFYLQAGAFQKSTDADNLKAKLALMGLETSVLEASVPEKGVMYRVRVGPYATAADMNRVRNQLSQNGIQATVIKIREKAPAAATAP